MTRSRSSATVALAALFGTALAAVDCGGSTSEGSPDASTSDGGDASLASDGGDMSADAGADGGSGNGLVPLAFPAPIPPDFPAHFSALTPPPYVAVLQDLCGIDTGTSARMPSVTLCPKGAPMQTSMPPNLMVVPAQNATVLWVTKLDITHTVKVTGTRALAIVSADELAVEALVDVSAVGATAGPGAIVNDGVGVGAATACDAGASGSGGGAGFGGDGGDSPFASGGMLYGADAGLFVGGSSGGGACAKGGGGGGALQLSSAASLLVLPAGSLRAEGGGGEGTSSGSSAGGGSGGTIYLESLKAFVVSTDVTANGGGGGASSSAARSGSNGLTSQMPAPGGFAGDGGANGGSGGVAAISATNGVSSTTDPSLAGSGGGAAGRIWLRSAKVPTGTPSFSPAPVVLTF